MVPEATFRETDNGLIPEGEGWYVVTARDMRWWHSDELGSFTPFEGNVSFPQFGININVLPPRPAELHVPLGEQAGRLSRPVG